MQKEIEGIIKQMKPKKGRAQVRFFGVAYVLILIAISVIIYFTLSMMNEGNVMSVSSLVVALISLAISITNFILDGTKKKNFIIHKLSDDKRIEAFVLELQEAAKKEKITIMNIDLFKHKNAAYLKIFY